MPNRSRKPKRPVDFNERAFQSVQILTGTAPPLLVEEEPEDPIKTAARELGRRGGLVGGKARSENMTPEERAESARKAAAARWQKRS